MVCKFGKANAEIILQATLGSLPTSVMEVGASSVLPGSQACDDFRSADQR